MSAWALGAWALGAWAGTAWAEDFVPPVEPPAPPTVAGAVGNVSFARDTIADAEAERKRRNALWILLMSQN